MSLTNSQPAHERPVVLEARGVELPSSTHLTPPLESFLLFSPGTPVESEDDLLRRLASRRISQRLETLYFVGAHRYQERALINQIFPRLKRIYLFEPLPHLFSTLQETTASDPRIRVFPLALSNCDGTARFHVTTNDAASSSLLPLGTHRDIFPNVGVAGMIEVRTRTLESVAAEFKLPLPDLLILDVQGAEHQILSSLSEKALRSLRLIFTEASTEQVYVGARTLSDISSALAPRFAFLGFAPLTNHTPMHGNALFVRTKDLQLTAKLTHRGRLVKYLQRFIEPNEFG
jgi:FkbM family methyltransferase